MSIIQVPYLAHSLEFQFDSPGSPMYDPVGNVVEIDTGSLLLIQNLNLDTSTSSMYIQSLFSVSKK